jgi:hypothetical protein
MKRKNLPDYYNEINLELENRILQDDYCCSTKINKEKFKIIVYKRSILDNILYIPFIIKTEGYKSVKIIVK